MKSPLDRFLRTELLSNDFEEPVISERNKPLHFELKSNQPFPQRPGKRVKLLDLSLRCLAISLTSFPLRRTCVTVPQMELSLMTSDLVMSPGRLLKWMIFLEEVLPSSLG